MKKGWKMTAWILGWVIAIMVVALLGIRISIALAYHEYYDHSQAGFQIPGLFSGFVPQGFDYVEEADAYLISGYMKEDGPSRVYVRTGDGNTFYVELYQKDGAPYTRHCGGIAHNAGYAYIAGASGVEVFDLADILAGRDARQLGTVEVGYRVSYCTFQNGRLYAGNFYRAGNYETPVDHHITTPAGQENGGLITVFQGNSKAPFGVETIPVCGISTPGLVQGLCLTDGGEIVLSQSYSLGTGHLRYFDLNASPVGEITLLDTQVPLYYLDAANLTYSVDLPPMGEEVVFKNGRVWVMCESACTKYSFGLLIRGHQVFGFEKPEN